MSVDTLYLNLWSHIDMWIQMVVFYLWILKQVPFVKVSTDKMCLVITAVKPLLPHSSDYVSVFDPNSNFIHMMRVLEEKFLIIKIIPMVSDI